MLVLENISKTFNPGTPNEYKVFDGLSLEVKEGDFITVIGSNGAGKSTLLNIIAGVFPVDSGKIQLDGENITNLPEHRRAAFIGRVFQDPMLGTCPSMTVEENLSLAYSRCRNISLRWGITAKNRQIFRNYLARISLGLEDRLTEKVRSLSGGQRQALTLIMATMKKPRILLLDEHTGALDPKTAMVVNDLTQRIVKEEKITTIMVTHNLEDAIRMGNRLLMMHHGKIVLDIRGKEKASMTIERLLKKFEEVQGEKFAEDRIMLA